VKRALMVTAVLALVSLAIWGVLARSEYADYGAMAQEREDHVRDAQVVEVAVVWSDGDPRLWDGAKLALHDVRHVNAPGSPPCRGVLALRYRKPACLELRLTRYQPVAGEEVKQAREIARDTRFAAVIGHSSSDIAAFAAVSYEATDVLFLATSATDPSLTTRDDMKYVFRMTPDDTDFAEVMAGEVAARLRPKSSVGLLYTRTHHYSVTPYLERLISALTARQVDSEYEKAYPVRLTPRPRQTGFFADESARRTYLRNADALRSLLAALDRGAKVPAIILLDDDPSNAVNLLGRIAAMTPVPAVIGAAATDGVESTPSLRARHIGWQCVAAYGYVDGGWQRRELSPAPSDYHPPVYTASTFCADAPEVAPIASRYLAATKRPMDVIAMQGYDAVMILAATLAGAESAAPVDLAARLRSGKPLVIGTGRSVTFDLSGDLHGPPIFIRALRNAVPSSH
jgi:hypothetical protein